jgi:hypothetical protein
VALLLMVNALLAAVSISLFVRWGRTR